MGDAYSDYLRYVTISIRGCAEATMGRGYFLGMGDIEGTLGQSHNWIAFLRFKFPGNNRLPDGPVRAFLSPQIIWAAGGRSSMAFNHASFKGAPNRDARNGMVNYVLGYPKLGVCFSQKEKTPVQGGRFKSNQVFWDSLP